MLSNDRFQIGRGTGTVECRMFALNIKDCEIALEMSRETDILEWSKKQIKTSCANDYTYYTMIFRYSNA
jgi:hypothetical protein